MPIERLLTNVVVCMAGAAIVVVITSLLRLMWTAVGPAMFFDSLEVWLRGVVFHAALIILAAAMTNYICQKK